MMRKLLLLLMVSFGMQAQKNIDFRDGNFSDILQLSKMQNKPIMFMGYASWCEHCKKMKSEVITNPAVADFFNENFVCAWHDMETGEGLDIAKKYNVRAFPTFLFFNPSGELIYAVSGEMTSAEFIAEGKNALIEKNQLPYLKAQFEANRSNAEKCLAYVSALRKSNLETDAVAKSYLSMIPDNDLITETNWRIIANGIRDIDSREFQFVLKNQAGFAAVSSAKRVDRKIVNMVQEWLTPYVDKVDTVGYLKKRPAAAAIGLRKTDSIVFSYDLKIFERANGWKTYRRLTRENVKKTAWNNQAQLKEIALNYMNHIPENAAIEDAIGWAKRSLELKDSYDVQIIIARLYLLKGDKKSAGQWAEKARNVALGYKWDTKFADEILNQLR